MVWYSIVDIVFFRLSWNSRKKLSSLAQGLQQVLIISIQSRALEHIIQYIFLNLAKETNLYLTRV